MSLPPASAALFPCHTCGASQAAAGPPAPRAVGPPVVSPVQGPALALALAAWRPEPAWLPVLAALTPAERERVHEAYLERFRYRAQ